MGNRSNKLATCIFNINVCGISSQTHMTRHLGVQTHWQKVRHYRCVLRSGCRLASGDSTPQNAFRHPACFIGTFTSVRTSICRYKWLSDNFVLLTGRLQIACRVCVCVCVACVRASIRASCRLVYAYKTAQPKSALKDQLPNKVTILLTALTALLSAPHRQVGNRIKKASTFFFFF